MPGHAWNGEERPISFCLVAMASPQEMGRNGSMFCAHLCQHLMAGLGSVSHRPSSLCKLLRSITLGKKDFTQPEMELGRISCHILVVTNEWQMEWVKNESKKSGKKKGVWFWVNKVQKQAWGLTKWNTIQKTAVQEIITFLDHLFFPPCKDLDRWRYGPINYMLSTVAAGWWIQKGDREDKSELLATSLSWLSPPALSPESSTEWLPTDGAQTYEPPLRSRQDTSSEPDWGSSVPWVPNVHTWILWLSHYLLFPQLTAAFCSFLYRCVFTHAQTLDCAGTLIWGLDRCSDYVYWLPYESFPESSCL